MSDERKQGGVDPTLPPMDFSGMVISFGTSALINLGQVADPLTGKVSREVEAAKQTIDFLGIIAEKSKGNLTPEEDQLLTKLLFDLRMGYVKATS